MNDFVVCVSRLASCCVQCLPPGRAPASGQRRCRRGSASLTAVGEGEWLGPVAPNFDIARPSHCIAWHRVFGPCPVEDTVEKTKRGRGSAVGPRRPGSGIIQGQPSQEPTLCGCVACHVGAEAGILEAQPPAASLARGSRRLDTESHASTRGWLGRPIEAVKLAAEDWTSEILLSGN